MHLHLWMLLLHGYNNGETTSAQPYNKGTLTQNIGKLSYTFFGWCSTQKHKFPRHLSRFVSESFRDVLANDVPVEASLDRSQREAEEEVALLIILDYSALAMSSAYYYLRFKHGSYLLRIHACTRPRTASKPLMVHGCNTHIRSCHCSGDDVYFLADKINQYSIPYQWYSVLI